jgi:MFS family permease
MVAGPFLGGWLGDRLGPRFGRRVLIAAPWTVLLFGLLPMFSALAVTRSAALLVATAFLLGLLDGIYFANVILLLAERLPMAVRGRGLGVIYAVAISVFGGSTQFTVAWLTGVTGSPLAPAAYATGAVALAFLAILALPPEKRGALVGTGEPVASSAG